MLVEARGQRRFDGSVGVVGKIGGDLAEPGDEPEGDGNGGAGFDLGAVLVW